MCALLCTLSEKKNSSYVTLITSFLLPARKKEDNIVKHPKQGEISSCHKVNLSNLMENMSINESNNWNLMQLLESYEIKIST